MRISDWSSDVCSSDLAGGRQRRAASGRRFGGWPGDLRSKLGASPFALEGARERDRNSGCQAPLFRSRHMRLSRFFITRPIFAAVIAIFITIVGGIAYLGLPVSQYPDIVPPTVTVTASYPGATAQTV